MFRLLVCGVIWAAAALQSQELAAKETLPAQVNPNQVNSNPASVEPAEGRLTTQFQKKGVALGAPIFLRVYKQTSELELWAQKGMRYVLVKTYAICRWSGGLGPKLAEGDRQSPEGLYHIRPSGVFESRRWHRALRLNYPNSFDKANGRTGSGILIHGKCSSTGCFALDDEQIEDVFEAAEAAFAAGQSRIPVLSLPFRFTKDLHADANAMTPGQFWHDLRRADALFERDRLPPVAWLCDGRYHFADRRGNHKRRVVQFPNCRPLDKTVPLAVATKPDSPKPDPAAPPETPKQAAQKNAKKCDPRDPRCRLLRLALNSSVACPRKYKRCRAALAAYTKSVECPLKYPRCRGAGRVARSRGEARSVDVRVRRLRR